MAMLGGSGGDKGSDDDGSLPGAGGASLFGAPDAELDFLDTAFSAFQNGNVAAAAGPLAGLWSLVGGTLGTAEPPPLGTEPPSAYALPSFGPPAVPQQQQQQQLAPPQAAPNAATWGGFAALPAAHSRLLEGVQRLPQLQQFGGEAALQQNSDGVSRMEHDGGGMVHRGEDEAGYTDEHGYQDEDGGGGDDDDNDDGDDDGHGDGSDDDPDFRLPTSRRRAPKRGRRSNVSPQLSRHNGGAAAALPPFAPAPFIKLEAPEYAPPQLKLELPPLLSAAPPPMFHGMRSTRPTAPLFTAVGNWTSEQQQQQQQQLLLQQYGGAEAAVQQHQSDAMTSTSSTTAATSATSSTTTTTTSSAAPLLPPATAATTSTVPSTTAMVELVMHDQPPQDVRTKTPSENRSFSVTLTVVGGFRAVDGSTVRVELMYADALSGAVEPVAKKSILGGPKAAAIGADGAVRFDGLCMLEASTKHKEREFCLEFVLLSSAGRPVPSVAPVRSRPFYAYSHNKVLSRRRNIQLRALNKGWGPVQGGEKMHVIGSPFIIGPSLRVVFRTPVGDVAAPQSELYSDSVLFFELPPYPVPLPDGAEVKVSVMVTNDGKNFSNALDFVYMAGAIRARF